MKCVIVSNKTYSKSKRGTYRVVVQYYDESGKLKKKEFENKKKARAKADANVFIVKLQKFDKFDIINPKAKDDFSSSLNEWYINFKRDRLKRSAQDTFESTLKNHIFCAFPNKSVIEIDANMIQFLINEKKLRYSISTVKKIFNILNQYFSYLCANRIIVHNPMQSCSYKTHQSKVDDTKEKIFTDEEIIKIKEIINCKNNNGAFVYKDAHVFNLILNTGLREGEVLALKNSDIDLTNKTLSVNKEIREVRKRNKIGETTKGIENIITSPKSKSGFRTIPLNKEAINSIKILQESSPNNDDFLIHDGNGNFLSENALRKRFKRILNKVGIENKSIHMLRHTFATKMVSGIINEKTGKIEIIPIEVVSRILGHSSIQTTERIYVHHSKNIEVSGFENLSI